MIDIKQSTAFEIDIFAFDANGDPVTGITNGQWTKRIAKAGGAFTIMTTVITELGAGWYRLTLSTTDTDTLGLLNLYFNAPGTKQLNFQYNVVTKLVSDLDVTTFPTGAVVFPYTITSSTTSLPLDGVQVWISTDVDALNVIWSGFTDAFGVARDVNGNEPHLDVGTYYFWRQKSGYLANDPQSVIVAVSGSGSDTLTPISGGFLGGGFPSTAGRQKTYVSLGYYARFIGTSESSVYGIVRETEGPQGCDNYYWNESMRYQLVKAMIQAEKRMQKYLKYSIQNQWVCDEVYSYEGLDMKLRRGMVATMGKKIEELVAVDVPTGVAGFAEEYDMVVEVDFTDCSELVVFYPGQAKWEIDPSSVIIEDGFATITIPRARLLKQEFQKDFSHDDDNSRPRYEDSSNFVDTIDVYRRWPDEAQSVTFIWDRKGCGCCTTCSHSTIPGQTVEQTGAPSITDQRLGLIHIEPATFDEETGQWVAAGFTMCRPPDRVKISYVSGFMGVECDDTCPPEPDENLARAVIALAHSNMPLGVCNCDKAQQIYKQDHDAPVPEEAVTILSPFGITRGQVLAWTLVSREAIGVGGLFA